MPEERMEQLIRENAELRARVAELSRSLAHVEAVSQLTVGVVHDLRNAFHAVLLAGEALQGSSLDASQAELIDAVVSAGRHAAGLARDLLAVARKEDARNTIVDLAEFFRGFERLLQRLLSKRFELRVSVSPDCFPIGVERPQLEAALINLSVNARDAMPRGGCLEITGRNLVRVHVAPGDLPAGDYVELCVEDTGVGMPGDVLARATEAFFTTKHANGGTGLGLAMAHAFARRAGGALFIDSEVGRGTRVRILLPRAHPPRRTIDDASELERPKLQRIHTRIRSGWIRGLLEEWQALRPDSGLPRPVALEAAIREHIDDSIVLALDGDALRLVRMGNTLSRVLGHNTIEDLPLDGGLVIGSLDATYRRALHSSFPSYEYARYSFGGGESGEFERLILPAAVDARNVSHLIGLIRLPINLLNGGADDHVTAKSTP